MSGHHTEFVLTWKLLLPCPGSLESYVLIAKLLSETVREYVPPKHQPLPVLLCYLQTSYGSFCLAFPAASSECVVPTVCVV